MYGYRHIYTYLYTPFYLYLIPCADGSTQFFTQSQLRGADHGRRGILVPNLTNWYRCLMDIYIYVYIYIFLNLSCGWETLPSSFALHIVGMWIPVALSSLLTTK